MRKTLACLSVAALLAAAGCTVRYSKSLDNSSPVTGRRVSASSSGLEIFGIQVNDVASAAELSQQISARCKQLRNVETDYRSTVILFVAFPKLTVSADCR